MNKPISFRTPSYTSISTIDEQKSKFIATISPVSCEDDVKRILLSIKKQHPKANHHCYAYRLEDGSYRSSDAGEPSGTAGMPIYMTLERNGLMNTLIVITRYFGGILLGAGGLTRTYRNSAELAIKEAKIKEMRSVPHFHICIPLSDISLLEARLAQWHVTLTKRIITDEATYEGYSLTPIIEQLINLGNGKYKVTDLGYDYVSLI